MLVMNTCLIVVASALLVGCGGGGGDETTADAVVLQGSLIQGSEASSQKLSQPRVAHSAGELIPDVEVCALGACSKTDAMGRWGFAVDNVPAEIQFTLTGHGISDMVSVSVPELAKDITIEFENLGDTDIVVHSVVADGAEVEQGEDGHDHGDETSEHSSGATADGESAHNHSE